MNPKRAMILIFLISLFILCSIFLIKNISFEKKVTGEVIKVNTISQVQTNEFDKRNQTIILYNENYLPGKELAEYYANAREINYSRICPIKVRPSLFITGNELREVRKQIVENCICDILESTNSAPSPCNIQNIDAIANISPISHMVSIKGMPQRLTNTGWSFEEEVPGVDYYLSAYIYAKEDIFGPTSKNGTNEGIFAFNDGKKPYCGFNDEQKWSQALDTSEYVRESDGNYYYTYNSYWYSTSMRSYVRTINISLDRKLAFGRIEAITPERTKELIDRTILIENQGISGNFVSTLTLPGGGHYIGETVSDYRFLSELVSNKPSICDKYTINRGLWNYTLCRAGASLDGNIPGEGISSGIPLGYNIGLFLGEDYGPNGQIGFEGFYTMANWRVNTSTNCKIFCSDFSTQLEKDLCKQKSKDYFKDLNSDCVGGNLGLIGWQYRSYPVTFYGYRPRYWEGQRADTPEYMSSDSYKNQDFTDDKYIRFGNNNSIENPTCINATTNEEYICRGYLSPNLLGYFYPPITTYVNPEINITFSYMYRYPDINKNRGMSPALYVSISNGSNSSWTGTRDYSQRTGNSPNTWEKYERTLIINKTNTPLTGNIKIDRYEVSIVIDNLIDWFDLDAIVLKDETNNISILKGYPGASSFNSTNQYQNEGGSYAFNAIDRLGGIGWWGSGSHHLTGGHSYRDSTRFLGTFFSGRTIGESITYAGCYGEESGFVYVDPLYNPSGVKIYTSSRFINGEIPRLDILGENEYIITRPNITKDETDKNKIIPYFIGKDYNNTNETLRINAFHGKNRSETNRWILSACYDTKTNCIEDGIWVNLVEGEGAAYALDLPLRFIDLVKNKSESSYITLKLKVWNIGEEQNTLSNYASLYYVYSNNLDIYPPEININYPLDLQSISKNIGVNLNFSINEVNIDSCWYNINNGPNITLTNCQNTTFNAILGKNILNLYAKDTSSNIGYKNTTFNAILNAPEIRIISPINEHQNSSNIRVIYNVTDINGINSCSIYSYHNNIYSQKGTNGNVNQNAQNYFDISLNEGINYIGIYCLDNQNRPSSTLNKTIIIDSNYTKIELYEPLGIKTHKENIPLKFSIFESNIDYCWYNINNKNYTLTSCQNTTFDTFEGEHTLTFFVKDKSGNINKTITNFEVNLPFPIIDITYPKKEYHNSSILRIKYNATDINGIRFCGIKHNILGYELESTWQNWIVYSGVENYVFDQYAVPQKESNFSIFCENIYGKRTYINKTIKIDYEVPEVSILEPKGTKNKLTNIPLIFESFDMNIDSCWYNINNGPNITLTNCQNTTFSAFEGEHTLNLYVNDSAGNLKKEITSFNIIVDAPEIDILSPSFIYHNISNLNISYNATDINGISSCTLYSDFNGTYGINSSYYSIISGTKNDIEIILNEGTYNFSLHCNNTIQKESYTPKQKLVIDLTPPKINIIYPKGIINLTRNIELEFNIEEINKNICWSKIYHQTDLIEQNNNLDCEGKYNLTIQDPGTYIIELYSKDLAGNIGSSNSSFIAVLEDEDDLPPIPDYPSAPEDDSGGPGGPGGPINNNSIQNNTEYLNNTYNQIDNNQIQEENNLINNSTSLETPKSTDTLIYKIILGIIIFILFLIFILIYIIKTNPKIISDKEQSIYPENL